MHMHAIYTLFHCGDSQAWAFSENSKEYDYS